MDYKKSGVNIDNADKMLENISEELGENKGLYGGTFPIYKYLKDYNEPVLVSSTDGVGTKMMLLEEEKQWNTAAIDLIAMNLNDLVCMGAKPLFFMDYYATGKLNPIDASNFVKELSKELKKLDCQLIGGETAELPGIFSKGKVDVDGFVVGIVEKNEILSKEKVKENDILIAIKSNGVHSNGFSLVRKLLEEKKLKYSKKIIAPTKLIVKQTLKIKNYIHAAAHITGGGIEGNLIRIIPEGLTAKINMNWNLPEIFDEIREAGVNIDDMLKTFNMGITIIYAVSKENEKIVLDELKNMGEDPIILGKVEKGSIGVEIIR
ncbi:phosphoribosylformylglycinamidine cyclo-ligase [Tepiditoga spiralis]|uniref:Phosphoribosylformylglycinamidine cyclo-ligase n=1 Tax=Tepiditoga spiralis TaxID=2108365 RepID=A0A7G1G8H2_9BACT|nr:phosphoribosylformylglycinamidine cyclo-ligase [Tepiditoga spiralis]BBE31213.1 phosphoribosylformylglycinamidine cyclo-ligase [Tepiditoga spiralis]